MTDRFSATGTVRTFAFASFSLGAAGLLACHPEMKAVGGSPYAVGQKGAKEKAASETRAPALPSFLRAEARSYLAPLTAAPVPSRGHFVDTAVVLVRANDVAQRAYATGARGYPAGSVFVAEHGRRNGDGPKLATYAMQKGTGEGDAGAGQWRFMVVSSGVDLVADGPIESCAGCHREAPDDGVFRVAQ